MNTISGYDCNACGSGYLDNLKTGCLYFAPDKSGYHRRHTQAQPKKPINGVFYDTGVASYMRGGYQIGHSGFVEIEMNGGVNAYLKFDTSIGDIQYGETLLAILPWAKRC